MVETSSRCRGLTNTYWKGVKRSKRRREACIDGGERITRKEDDVVAATGWDRKGLEEGGVGIL